MSTPVDLRPFLRTMGGRPTRGALDVPEREEPEVPAELLDAAPQKITAPSHREAIFIDGVQSASVLTYRMHRPVTLVMAGAGSVKQDLSPVKALESLEVLCAREDQQWVIDADCPVPVRVVEESSDPVKVERATAKDLTDRRDELEILLAAELLSDTSSDTQIMVDGHLANRPEDPRLLGVIKTTNTRLLTDESVLWGLPQGWRSPRFVMPEHFGGPSAQRYSCYVRLRNAEAMPWGFGLIRLEAFDPDLLDRAAATALAHRQPTGTRDARGDRHLQPVAQVEKWMRSRRPSFL